MSLHAGQRLAVIEALSRVFRGMAQYPTDRELRTHSETICAAIDAAEENTMPDTNEDGVTVVATSREAIRTSRSHLDILNPAPVPPQVDDIVRILATVAGAPPVQATRTMFVVPERVSIMYRRSNGAPYELDMESIELVGSRVLKNSLGQQMTISYWFKRSTPVLPDWLVKFAVENTPERYASAGTV
jgi:hypothetical protein